MKKKVLITGGSGFIGGWLSKFLNEHGYAVSILDLVEPDSTFSGIEYLKSDVRNKLEFKEILSRGWHAVYHFAAIVSVPECEKSPDQSFETNYVSTITLLDSVKSLSNPPLVFFASSAAVYGDLCQKGSKLREDDALPAPNSFYGLHKYASEQSLRLYCKNFGIHGMSFRFFNVYGPGQNGNSPYSGVISKFKEAFLHNRSVVLFNQGENYRDFIHVHDIVSACAKALDLSLSQLDGSVLNLCTGRSISVRELYFELVKQEGKDPGFENAQPRAGDIQYSCGDASQAREILNWRSNPDLNLVF